MSRNITVLIFFLLVFSGVCLGQTDILENVPQLQQIALRATGGAMGCGKGTYTLVTDEAEKKVSSSLDPIHVFGKTIRLSDMNKLLEAREIKPTAREKFDVRRSWFTCLCRAVRYRSG